MFDQFSSSGSLYLFLKARTAHDWEQAEAAAPPLNLLSIPYTIAVMLMRISGRKGQDDNDAAQANRFRPSNAHRRWLYMGSVEDLTKAVSKFAREHSGQSMSKRMECISLTREVGRLKFMLNYQQEKLIKIVEQQQEIERSVLQQQQAVPGGVVKLEVAQTQHEHAPETIRPEVSVPTTVDEQGPNDDGIADEQQPAEIEGGYDSLRVEIDHADFLNGGSMGSGLTSAPNEPNAAKGNEAQIQHYLVPRAANGTTA
eukprot:6896751-Prymnesium_polylepis.1